MKTAKPIRKLRKLLRDPWRFFRDARQNRLAARSLERLRARDEHAPKLRGTFRYSIVSAVFDAAPYLDDFLQSLVDQSLDFASHIELVLVDDGSRDDTPRILESWRSRHPNNIKVLRKENGGQGSARNFGLPHATGDFVTFTDPDDFLDLNYFAELDAFLSRPGNERVEFVATRIVFFHERNKKIDDSHPLAYRFNFGNRTVALQDLALDIPASSTIGLFRHATLERIGLRFDSRIRPSFEDGHFTNKFLLELDDAKVGFCAEAFYYYRKRASGDSTIDTSWPMPQRFDDVLKFGYLDLIERALEKHGRVPSYLQHVLLYDLYWYFRRIVGNIGAIGFLSQQELDTFKGLVAQVMRHISPDTLYTFHLAGFRHRDLVGMLGLYHGLRPSAVRLEVIGYDQDRQQLKLKYDYMLPTEVEVRSGDRVLPQLDSKVCSTDFVGDTFVNERIFWVDASNLDERITASSVDGEVHVFVKGVRRADAPLMRHLAAAWRPLPIRDVSCPQWAQELRNLARSPNAKAKYENCWVLMDRDREAEDNAERLYFHLRAHHPELRLFFVVAKDTPCWKRLEAQGVDLLDYGSVEHRLALLLSEHYISSHADAYVVNVLNPKWFGDIRKYRFTFLQHGIIKDDLSRWLNTKAIDLFITSTGPEYESIVKDGSPYVFGTREVALTGLARHDTLLAGQNRKSKVVLIMPTWRQSLARTATDRSSRHIKNDGFFESDYAVHWKSFLHSDTLQSLATEYGYQVWFCPHINLHPYLEGFEVPSYIRSISHDEGIEIQSLFQQAALMITDFSSVAFEMALLGRPVIYYHFDFEAALKGAHSSLHGYFDYARDGFGPLCLTEDQVLDALEDLLERGAEPSEEYARRMEQTFAFRDGRNRERIYEAIMAIKRP